MAMAFPDKYRDLFDKKAFGALTTLMPDGSPQTTRVAIAISDPDNPYPQPGGQRVVYKIAIEKAQGMGQAWPF